MACTGSLHGCICWNAESIGVVNVKFLFIDGNIGEVVEKLSVGRSHQTGIFRSRQGGRSYGRGLECLGIDVVGGQGCVVDHIEHFYGRRRRRCVLGVTVDLSEGKGRKTQKKRERKGAGHTDLQMRRVRCPEERVGLPTTESTRAGFSRDQGVKSPALSPQKSGATRTGQPASQLDGVRRYFAG